MHSLTVAFAPIARPTFDIPFAQSITDSTRQHLANRSYRILDPIGLIDDLPAAELFASHLAESDVDLLLILQATFADSRMLVRLAEATEAPVLLWAIPEEATGGRLRLNSLTGINLAGHALKLRNRKYWYLYAQPEEERAYQTVHNLAQAGHVKNMLKTAKLGVVGEHPDGMDTCHLDAQQLRETFGVEVKQFALDSLFKRMSQVEARSLAPVQARLQEQLPNLNEMPQAALNGTLQAHHALEEMRTENNLSGFAVRCWPEFFEQQGCAACGAMSLLNDRLIPSACEADVNGTLTQLILQWLSGTPAFGADVVSADLKDDYLVIWHCGKAPLSMADPAAGTEAGFHSNRLVPLVMEFPLKPGPITAARLSRSGGALRLVVGAGEVLSAPKSFSGTSGVMRFDRPADQVLDTILGEGLEHHIAITYNNHVPALLALAELLELPILRFGY